METKEMNQFTKDFNSMCTLSSHIKVLASQFDADGGPDYERILREKNKQLFDLFMAASDKMIEFKQEFASTAKVIADNHKLITNLDSRAQEASSKIQERMQEVDSDDLSKNISKLK